MSLNSEIETLSTWLDTFPKKAKELFAQKGDSLYVLDFIVFGALKRSLSLGSGLLALIDAKNIVCARAILRMHLDTVSRLCAYTYVQDAEGMAKEILGGKLLRKFKARDGNTLTDNYLIEQLAKQFPWIRKVYDFTSGYVHFSERQFFDTVYSLGSDEERTVQLSIGRTDNKYPEYSWEELPACFNRLNIILEEFLIAYVDVKVNSNNGQPPSAAAE